MRFTAPNLAKTHPGWMQRGPKRPWIWMRNSNETPGIAGLKRAMKLSLRVKFSGVVELWLWLGLEGKVRNNTMCPYFSVGCGPCWIPGWNLTWFNHYGESWWVAHPHVYLRSIHLANFHSFSSQMIDHGWKHARKYHRESNAVGQDNNIEYIIYVCV